jgi:Rps23 Pro-64 3,4-dihydroxylase Tpa1-like proline 4-hydroxylase
MPKRKNEAHVNSQQVDGLAVMTKVISPFVLSRETIRSKQLEYETSSPYPHVCIDGICDDKKLRGVFEELQSHLTLSYKETDLFKVLQSVDIASIDDRNTTHLCGQLLALREDLYGENFRNFVQQITGCPALDSRVDCSCNVYAHSGHLLCHDDVISSRCISFIIYLASPDDEWKVEDGGALEFYSISGEHNLPYAEPTKTILPRWNSMVFFQVQPGKSFHAVQEVFASCKPRVSISGWYHVSRNQPGAERASAQMLLTRTYFLTEEKRGCDSMSIVDSSCVKKQLSRGPFSKKDAKYLSQWVNREYLHADGMARLRDHFHQHGSVLLRDFLREDVVLAAKRLLASTDSEESRNKEWILCGPPHVRRFVRFDSLHVRNDDSKKNTSFVEWLVTVRRDIVLSDPFARWMSCIVDGQLGLLDDMIRRFRRGSDYTVAIQNPDEDGNRITATLCFVNDFTPTSRIDWSNGEVGGYVCHMRSSVGDKVSTPAEVYQQEDEEAILSIDASFNSLSLVLQGRDEFNFVKYVARAAPSSRWDIILNTKVMEV